MLALAPLLALLLQPAPTTLRDRAWAALTSHVKAPNYLHHAQAVEAIMLRLSNGRQDWAAAGLLHDIDIESTRNDLARHGAVGAALLRKLDFPEPIVHAVLAHDDRSGVARTSPLDHALFCADQLFWLIRAAALPPSTPDADVLARIRALPEKAPIVQQIESESRAFNSSLPQALSAALAALRK